MQSFLFVGMEWSHVSFMQSVPPQEPRALVPPRKLHAYVDEAGVRSHSKASGDYFVMSAVVVADEDVAAASDFLAGLRRDLRRRPGDTLHWQNFNAHSDRLHAAKSLGAQEWATISSVVVAKRQLGGASQLNEDQAYLYTLRFLLERLSWHARDSSATLTYTLAHIVRMQLFKLREYEANLRGSADCRIHWPALDPKGGRMDQPKRIEMLQAADIAASATHTAFNPDKYGNVETRYLHELSPRLYRRGGAPLTSYGLKMHPWNGSTKAAYPWVAAL
ncbi:DUF3800 domain-containing protein [Streptomyces sp. AM 2-1-1]|uniref:DUF3800 domain-containing protein n=1 Tax=Streptomyces sp. AM 2-1-1 TaxID=3028709 RepID=UPI0023BA17FE|nr:DUF3800 domain-containing protein [Streptomyces sp. AM 2-1-1]WEH40773.1 DUF3800 domain-containing protein [Streptomyces sp. AM 2-1-1]